MNSRFSLLAVIALLAAGGLYLLVQPPAADLQPAPVPTATPVATEPAPKPAPVPKRAERTATRDEFFILAVSWQPAFCETRPDTPECRSQSRNRFDASNFTLHGLWPQPEYCGISSRIEQADRSGRWSTLPELDLPPDLQRRLNEAMPGTRSQLDRHEWTKHGSCFDGDAEQYFAASLTLLDQLNASPVRDLFADNVGKRVTQQQVRAAFDRGFGKGTGERVRLSCADDGDRTLVNELTLGLWGSIGDDPDLAVLLAASRPTSAGCRSGLVDAVGLQ